AYQAGGFRERPSLVQRGEYPGLGVSIESVFGATVKMCDQFRGLARSGRIMFSNLRFYIDGQRIEDPSEHLMHSRDGNFVGWHNRVERIDGEYRSGFNQ